MLDNLEDIKAEITTFAILQGLETNCHDDYFYILTDGKMLGNYLFEGYTDKTILDYNEKVNDFILSKVKEYSSNNLWQDIAERINDVEIVAWRQIILSALKLSSNPEQINFDNWNNYIKNHKKNLSIALNQVICETQEKTEFSSSVKIKRFKPL